MSRQYKILDLADALDRIARFAEAYALAASKTSYKNETVGSALCITLGQYARKALNMPDMYFVVRWKNQYGSGTGRRRTRSIQHFPPDGLSHTEENYAVIYGLDGESDQERAFRRFPIDKHKPG